MSATIRPWLSTFPACAVLLLSPIVPNAVASTWVVNATGIGDDFPTLQTAISSTLVLSGDTILLRDGTYAGPGNRDVDFMGKNVVVRSMSMNPQNCVIDCQGTPNAPHRGFLLYQGESGSAWIQAIKIIHGYTLYSPGAGIHVAGTSSPIIDRCIIQSCTAEGGDGGGISCGDVSTPTIQNCQILANGCGGIPPGHGGGIFSDIGAAPGIISCTVSGNNAGSQQGPNAGGGGIYISGGMVDFCTVSGNYANGPGGGIHSSGAPISYSDIWSNSTTYGNGGGVFMNGGSLDFSTVMGNFGVGGGGVFATGASIGRCAITGNVSPGDGGGGVYAVGSSIQRCTIAGNNALAGGGALAQNTTFNTTIVWGNCATTQANEVSGDATDTFTCCCVNPAGVVGAVNYSGGQVFVNPIFCAPAPCNLAPTTQGNYQLGNTSQCLSANSPCGNLIGDYGQGCASAGADEGVASADLDLHVPSISEGPVEIGWSIPTQGPVRLAVYDVQGRSVAELVNEPATSPGSHETSWMARRDDGGDLSRGIYFVRLETAGGTRTRRVVLLGR